MIDHEGHELARWLVERGVVALVLKYRVGRSPDADEEVEAFRNDLQGKLGEVRRSGTMGSNSDFLRALREMGEEDGRQAIRFARAHAAEWGIDRHQIGIAGFSAGGSVALGAAMSPDPASRADFAVGAYPAPRSDLRVPENAPPLFLVISDDDKSVPVLATTQLYEAWHASGAPAELHVFGNGAHGWG